MKSRAIPIAILALILLLLIPSLAEGEEVTPRQKEILRGLKEQA